ncbi:unnamed protein product [Durusdinium trenchii]|uniref:Uncharacterized protein n=1 Tax=Durusdinium trenchii TaxID=1381693 RepID=A0ABP0IQK1_9DINO
MDGLHNGLRPQPLLGTWKAPGPFRPQILLKALRDRGVPRWTTWSSGASRATLALALAAVPHWRGTARRVAHHAVAPGAADWAAPVAVARSAAGEVELALGAVEQLVDGTRRLYGQILDEASQSWVPILLVESQGVWQNQDLSLSFSVEEMLGHDNLDAAAPSWPREVVQELSKWPLKGPGTDD